MMVIIYLGNDQSYMVDDVLNYHPEKTAKIGAGLNYIMIVLSLFRFIAALGRTQVAANTLGTFTLLMVFVLGGFVVARDDIQDWMIWGYYASPTMYGQNAIAINEFLSDRWSTIRSLDPHLHMPV
ncbi:ABC transporter domain-containing protein [Forsythia ovata]|uniref:ABC transporter domain-containing protein n=1 Tax=Forsythia ovata TaxID=205694 RepID=A0ABD1U648_9LAMI